MCLEYLNKDQMLEFQDPSRKHYRDRLYYAVLDLVNSYNSLSTYDKYHVLSLVRYKFKVVNKK